MTQEQIDQTEEQDEQVDQGVETPEQIVLSPEQYAAMLDRLEELEQTALTKSKPMDVDTLAEEVRRRQPVYQPPQQQVNLDAMTNSQLVNFIVDQVNQQVNQYAQPIVQDLEEVKLLIEIQKSESKHPDFWDYKDQIHKLGLENPHLSIEQAYLIASGQKRDVSKPAEVKGGDKRSAIITGLPPRPYSGEKPSGTVPKRAAGDVPVNTVKAAAAKAWDEVVGKDKKTL